MSISIANLPAVMTLVVIPREVIWSYFSFAVVFAIGLAVIFVRGGWRQARGFDKLILLGPIFYSAPLAAFGTEHFTLTQGMVGMIPAWIPWIRFGSTS